MSNNLLESLMTAVSEGLDEEYEVKCDVAVKRNDVKHPVLLVKIGSDVTARVYVEDTLKDLAVDKVSLEAAANKVIKNIRNESSKACLVSSIPETKNELLETVQYQLINKQMNRKYLEGIVHRDFLDLAVIYGYSTTVGNDTASIIMTDNILDWYEMTAEELEVAARGNTKKSGFICSNFAECVPGVTDSPDFSMYILSSKNLSYGASVLLFPECFKDLSEKLENDLYVLPSSIHEVIAVPVLDETPFKLAEMVCSVNLDLDREEILGNSVYRYFREQGTIEIACTGVQVSSQG